jgi:hypothetical protein
METVIMPIASHQPSDIVKYAQLINHLQSLLAWDLGATALESTTGGKPSVKLELYGAKYPLQMFLSSGVIEDAIEKEVVSTINQLETAGVDVSGILQTYKETGEKFAAQIANTAG